MRLRPLVLVSAMAAAFVVAATPASADGLAVEATVSPGEVQPGDAFTVTETVHNNTSGSILSPTIRLFSKEVLLPSYATMESCSGVGSSCTTVDTPSGPIGYMAVMPRALNGFETVTIVFTLRVKADAQGAVHTLQGQLLGRNDGIDPVDVATLTVISQADAGVTLSAAPKSGLLVPRIDVTVRVTNNGPGKLRSAEVRGALSTGLTANSGPGCTGGSQPVCTFGEIASGSSATGTFSVPLGLLYIGLPFRISATKTTSTPTDPVAGNNSAATTCTVVTPLLVSCN
jgi:uncharacterized protein DUF11